MSYRTKWLITIITMFIALSLIIVCVSQGMFSFKPGSVKANDKEDPAVTQKADDSDKDEPKESQYTVFVSAGNGGSANPNGKVTVDAWGSTTVSFTADEGYVIQSVVVDGEEMGALTSYTLSYITSDHTIMVTFEKCQRECLLWCYMFYHNTYMRCDCQHDIKCKNRWKP